MGGAWELGWGGLRGPILFLWIWGGGSWPRTQSFFCVPGCLNHVQMVLNKKKGKKKEKENVCILYNGQNFVV